MILRPRFYSAHVVGLALIAFFLSVLQAVAQPRELFQATRGDEPLAILRIGAEVGVVTPSGSIEPLLLPIGASLESIEPVADGWIAAGSRAHENEIDLFLLRDVEGKQLPIGAPGGFQGEPRFAPRLLVQNGRLLGIVWLQGKFQRELSVWAAEWTGTGWGAVESVSPQGPGAQLAPSVTVLEDGSWLLVWSAVDGHDDEIMWSRRVEGRWTSPERINAENTVPDVTPVVTTVEGGALVVWSFLEDRHFWLRSARFDGSGWSVGERFGYKGSHRARFFERGGRPALLYRTSAPAGWMVVDLDASGREVQRSFLARSDASQPIVDFRLTDEVRFLLPAIAPQTATTEELRPWGRQP